ncbi:complex I assembly factor ACAD9, mitochondrial-like isoform X1 [Stegodyphus dumicola]|uniref:complex I assembly factor ACAD9, mitochondrial-like isoform X1 n=1 Tax=Stegodyphus dumicola TaxID=202533 RepID=UPI0015AC27B1|nr:complex I assembly factor ACAD9, mitochondrial-like isoform X1 [Stegodyphus dumicola]
MESRFLQFILIRSKNVCQFSPTFRLSCGCWNVLRSYSTQNVQAEELVPKEKISLIKPSIKKVKRPPFVKNMFFGNFDTDLLNFPLVLDNEQLAEVENVVKNVNTLYAEKVNSVQIDRDKALPYGLLQDLKDMGLFGRMIPAKYGGLDLSYTACTRLNEVLGLDYSVYTTLAAHEFFAAQAILHFGSEEQKQKYLPLLASGKLIAAVCCSEVGSGSDLLSISTVAKMNTNGNFILTGSKCWVTNAELADIFIVFGKTPNLTDPNECQLSAFIVDKKSEGVHVSSHDKVCLRGTQTGIVTFDEVLVPGSNLIGSLGMGFKIYLKMLESLRLSLNTFTFGTLKSVLDSITQRIIHTDRIEKSLGDVQMIRRRLSKINAMIYAMESVSYFTAALIDTTENPDIELECAITKVFNSEGTLYCLRELMSALGSSSLMKEHQLERLYRDAQGLAVFDGPNDVVRLFIGLTGLKIVGAKKFEVVMIFRNRFFHPWDTLKQLIRHWRILKNMYKFDIDIAGHIHPSLVEWGNNLETALQKFEVAVEKVLSEHGVKVVETQIDPTKLANIAIELYVMTAVLSRCSRSYVDGLRNCHHEMRIAYAFCHDACVRTKKTIEDIYQGVTWNNELNHILLGEQVIDCKGYFPEHPLKHNF